MKYGLEFAEQGAGMTQDRTAKLLHDFLQMTDNIPPQVFFAHIAMLAVKEAQSQVAGQVQALRDQNTALTVQITEQQAGMQQLSAQYKVLLDRNVNLNASCTATQAHPEQDAVWTDPKTGLMWSRISIGQQWGNGQAVGTATKMNWEDANQACTTLHLAGFDDWRLPSRLALESLIVKDQEGYSAPEGALYSPDLSQPDDFGRYWSASPNASYSGYAWLVYFLKGGSGYYSKYNNYYVRAVRAGQ